MKLESAVRIMADVMVLLSRAPTHWVDVRWLWLTVFVGINLILPALTGVYPGEIILKKLGAGQSCRTNHATPVK